ncbi:MAG: DUF402 domain-containing protein [Turicibacter sp.]|nr:DUF402 domain-containing protein [Turicibacter sp.]
MGIPEIGQTVEIHSYKHNTKIHRIWNEMMVLEASEEVIIGSNHKTLVMEADGRTWYTREPAVWYFYGKYWFNVLCMLRKDGIYYYCNLSSPCIYDEKALKYIDYDLDIKIFPDMSYKILDEDEYKKHVREMRYSSEVQDIIKSQLDVLLEMISKRKGPFSPGFAEHWYYVYKSRKDNRHL